MLIVHGSGTVYFEKRKINENLFLFTTERKRVCKETARKLDKLRRVHVDLY